MKKKAQNQLQLFPDPKYVVSEIEISYKSKVSPNDRPRITCSKDSYDILLASWDDNKLDLQEQFNLLLLNRGNRVLGIYHASTGGVAGTVADPKLIFGTALKANASAIILSHNHPSGQLKPSAQDISMTKKMKQAGDFLEIPVLDHLIVTREGYYSFADEGLMP